ncbi:hypothetical protein Q3G72_013261 [Acer saccharum]|nr:hypothetical protein Q3G72_013261 [Acer saccharum]
MVFPLSSWEHLNPKRELICVICSTDTVLEQPQPHPHTDISRLKLNTFACRSSSICHLPPVIIDQSSLVRLLLAKSTLVVFNLFVSSFGPSISEFCSELLHFSSAT